jgi:WD40 repeat protein
MNELQDLEHRRRQLVEGRAELAQLQATVSSTYPSFSNFTVHSNAPPRATTTTYPNNQNTQAVGDFRTGSELSHRDNSATQSISGPYARTMHSRQGTPCSQQRLVGNVNVVPVGHSTRVAALSGNIEFNPLDHQAGGEEISNLTRADVPPERPFRGGSSVLQPAHHEPLLHSQWTCGRSVSALRWLPDLPQCLLSAHIPTTSSSIVSHDVPDGVVAVWDVEYAVFQRALIDTAPVTCIAVHPMSPSLVIAGTVYGNILTWDMRARTPTPFSCASTGSISVVRAVEATHSSSPFVLSASEDGTVCTWALANLNTPLESVTARERAVRDLRISAMGIPSSAVFLPSSESSSLGKRAVFCLAGEDGGLYRVDNANDRWVVHQGTARHDCPVTSLACHPGHPRYPQLSDVVVTTSMDWSVGVWSFGRRGPGLRLARLNTNTMDSASDVQWSPTHPGMFVVGDIAGGISVFDISQPDACKLLGRREVRDCQMGLEKKPKGSPLGGVKRLRWNISGSVLACGSDDGAVTLWSGSALLRNPEDSAWDIASAQIKHWRTQAAAAVPNLKELPNPATYVFPGIPPLSNSVYSET